MNKAVFRRGVTLAFAALSLGIAASPAVAAPNYQYDPELSLTGDCTTSPLDPIADPGCPDPPRPSARFAEPRSVAIDIHGDEYVASYAATGTNGRIDVFDDEGKFLTELADPFGPKSVAVDSEGNLYVSEQAGPSSIVVALYEPTVYKPDEGEIEYDDASRKVLFTDQDLFEGGVSVDTSNDHLFVARGTVIREYSSAKEGNLSLTTITNPKLNSSNWLAVDGQRRRLYASSCQKGIEECGVLVFDADAPHNLLEEIDGSSTPEGKFRSKKGWLSIAVDEETGHFLVDDLEQTKNIYEFGEGYEFVSTIQSTTFKGGNALQIAVSNAEAAFNYQTLFIPVLQAPTRVFAYRLSGVGPPEVEGIEAPNIGETNAELHATISPHGADTDYVIEYVSEAAFELEGFVGAKLGGEGTVPGQIPNRQIAGIASGLTPGTAYRFRVIATNEMGSAVGESTFSTYSDASPGGGTPCANLAFRIGLSSSLPDCRAYELVTPADTNGRPPKGMDYTEDGFPLPTPQASPDGNAVSFRTEGGPIPGLGGTGGFNGDPYRSTRSASGWSTVDTGPSGTATTILLPGGPSPDQGYNFWSAGGEGAAVIDGQQTGYVTYPDGHFELIGQGSLGSDPGARGKLITENGAHIIFATRTFSGVQAPQLEPVAPPTGTSAVYDRTSDGTTHVVSLLPGSITPNPDQNAEYQDASENGVGIAFSIGNRLYLRVDNTTTYEVGENVTLAGISEEGDRAFYVEAGDLFAFEAGTEERIAFTETGNVTVVNIASSGSRAYFVSPDAIAGAGENPSGAVPQAGQRNLYLSEEGVIRFVATVTTRDVDGEKNILNAFVDGLGLWTEVFSEQPAKDPSRTTPDGSVMVFQSRANLDGTSSDGSRQIYRYDSVANRLHCISCNPTKVPTTDGGAGLQTIGVDRNAPPPLSAFGFVPNLRPDGRRAFFESSEALVARDTDGVQDIYEWEEKGTGSCARVGGCLYLISSGHSTHDNYLFGASRSGDDVFFITDEALVADDNDALSIYDARVNGGFPQEAGSICQGEGCRPVLSPPPPLLSPVKPGSLDSDNVARKCPKGKRKIKRHGKVRCIKKHRSHHKKGAVK